MIYFIIPLICGNVVLFLLYKRQFNQYETDVLEVLRTIYL